MFILSHSPWSRRKVGRSKKLEFKAMKTPRGGPKGLVGSSLKGKGCLAQAQTGCRGGADWGEHCGYNSLCSPRLFFNEFSRNFVSLICLCHKSFFKFYPWLLIYFFYSPWYWFLSLSLLFISSVFFLYSEILFSGLSNWMFYLYAIIFLLINEFRAINHSVNSTLVVSC